MRGETFDRVLELMRLLLYFVTIICAVFIGFQLCAVHYQNELLKQDVLVLDLYLELENYNRASLVCYEIWGYVDFVALYGVAFFDIGIDLEVLNNKCRAIEYKVANPNWKFILEPIISGGGK